MFLCIFKTQIFKKYQRIVLGSVDVNKEKKASKSNTKTKETTSLDTTKEKQEEQKKQEHEGEEKQVRYHCLIKVKSG